MLTLAYRAVPVRFLFSLSMNTLFSICEIYINAHESSPVGDVSMCLKIPIFLCKSKINDIHLHYIPTLPKIESNITFSMGNH